MSMLLIFAVCVFIVLLILVGLRKHFINKEEIFSEKLNNIPSFSVRSRSIEGLVKSKERVFVNIPMDIAIRYKGKIITSIEESKVTNFYFEYFDEAYSLSRSLKTFGITPSETITNLIHDFGAIHSVIKHHNDEVIGEMLKIHKDFFDCCLAYPLDEQQRRSIVSEEDNCLVISSAGSGKTSSIIGKVRYLINIKGIDPRRILLISYTNKAAVELTERLGISGLKGYTFHKLALDIIGQYTGSKPSICDNTDLLLIEIFHELLKYGDFKKNIVEYFVDYQLDESGWQKRKNERREQLSEQKSVKIKALFPDMDGNTVYVKSVQEQKICFALSSLGVKFRYEEPYEYELSDEMHSQYKPDFSIYYKCGGAIKRLYLEHFGIDEHGLVPTWFAKDKNISYEEANRQYNDGITWKIEAHKKFGTKLLTTSSADFHYTDIREKLKSLLIEAGIPVKEVNEAELYSSVLPRKSKQEKAFIRMIATFIALIKSSCRSLESILREVEDKKDERSEFIIKNIFAPVYELYKNLLCKNRQIDFTDAILQAAEICQSVHPVEYDYIIVDEFQDISIDRYKFLKALRESHIPAKLYCVGDDWQSIYRFSGSDMALFNQFSNYFGPTEINKIETTYRFGEPLVSLSSRFIQRNSVQIQKAIHPFRTDIRTELVFYAYERREYCNTIEMIISSIPSDKSIFLLGRYSFDDYYLSFMYQAIKEDNRFFYMIKGRKIEFLTVHKSKGLEADYVILLQCNKDTYGFPSMINDDPVFRYVLTNSDQFPFGEERRLFYVATTRAKEKTIVLYDKRFPSVFVDEFLRPETIREDSYEKHPNANKRWTRQADQFLLQLHNEGKSIRYIAMKMGRSQTSIVMRLGKLNEHRE